VTLRRIVSGGQTGVDRAALDAALALGVDCGGWCPAGRLAEDGRIPDRYPLSETGNADYAERTRRNVEDSDATLIVTDGQPAGGTALTVRCCEDLGRPWLMIDATTETLDEALRRLGDFVETAGVATLNVAGPRASQSRRAGPYARALLIRWLPAGTP
jgi:hypothetical protein